MALISKRSFASQTHAEVVFEVMGRKGNLSPEQSSLRKRYSEGLAAYRARRWDEARVALAAALEVIPGDGPSVAMTKRVDDFQITPPGDDWDGSWHLDHK